jgi:hypothetical protein
VLPSIKLLNIKLNMERGVLPTTRNYKHSSTEVMNYYMEVYKKLQREEI